MKEKIFVVIILVIACTAIGAGICELLFLLKNIGCIEMNL